MTKLEAKKALLSCPGDTIQETIDAIGMSQAELAERLGRSIPKLNELIKGKASIKKDIAMKLEYVLGIPTQFWLNLERRYQDELIEIEKLEFFTKCIEWLKKFPIPQLKSLGYLPNTKEKPVLIEALLKFFRIASPVEWEYIYKENSLAFKIELRYTAQPEAISAWLRMGEIQSENLDLAQFNLSDFKRNLPAIQEIAFNHEYDWQQQLQKLCAECGIALVYTPLISKAPIYGATRWIRNNSIPLIQLTDRHKSNNSFWFSFYHEIAHVDLHGKKEIFIHGLEGIKQDPEKEKEADEYAAKKLIKESQLGILLNHRTITSALVKKYSQKWRIHPGIIVGQIQRKRHSLYKNTELNSLKSKIEFTS